jgi:Holliday junction DNA helicase RuvA
LAKQPLEANILPMKNNTLHKDALNALTALGINRLAAEQALNKVLVSEPNLAVEELIKKTLRIL